MSNWVVSNGWCVGENGLENGRVPHEYGLTQEECFDKCRANTNLKGCTHFTSNNKCVTYTGDVVGGNGWAGSEGYKCFHSRGKKYTLLPFG